MRLEDAKGVYVIAVTPFTETGALDLDGIDRLVAFYREAGADGLTILGLLGEAAKLTAEEARATTARFLARAGTMPVIVGVSAPGYAAMAELGRAAMDLGAAGVMVAPPSHLRTDEQILSWYQGAADALGAATPICLQDHPLAMTVQMSPPLLERILAALPSIGMVKHEDWPGLAKVTALRRAEAAGRRRVSILVGNGGLFLPEELTRGADGAMTGFAFPEMMAGVCGAMARGERARAHDLFDAYLPLVRYEHQSGIGLAVRKHVLALRGAIGSAALRRPGPRLSPEDIADVAWLLERQERRLAQLG